jgi:hypothetical protein
MESERIVISRKWRPGKVRPVQGNPPHDRLVSRVVFSSLKKSLRRSLECHPCLYTETPQYAFSQAWRNLSLRCGQTKTKPWGGTLPPPAGWPRAQVKERAGRITLFSSSAMSSGRLFLDRVARQQSPSPLHRQAQNNTHSSEPRAKGDISTLPGGGHFYLALTP